MFPSYILKKLRNYNDSKRTLQGKNKKAVTGKKFVPLTVLLKVL